MLDTIRVHDSFQDKIINKKNPDRCKLNWKKMEHISYFQLLEGRCNISFGWLLRPKITCAFLIFSHRPSVTIGLYVRNGNKMQRDRKMLDHTFFSPHLRNKLKYDITLLHNIRLCDLGTLFIFCNTVQTPLSAPQSALWANPESFASWEWACSCSLQ